MNNNARSDIPADAVLAVTVLKDSGELYVVGSRFWEGLVTDTSLNVVNVALVYADGTSLSLKADLAAVRKTIDTSMKTHGVEEILERRAAAQEKSRAAAAAKRGSAEGSPVPAQ